MKHKILLLLLFFTSVLFSQNDVYFYKDSDKKYNIENIHEIDFSLLTETISDGYNEEIYWFKIPKSNKNEDVVLQILNIDIHNIHVFKDEKEIKQSKYERFITYKFSNSSDIFIKIKPKKESYFPFLLISEKEFHFKERKEFLFIGLYFGFAIIIIFYNFIYFFIFKDDASLFYALFLTFISTGFFITDGFLNYFNLSEGTIEVLVVLNYIFLAYFSSKFSSTYLQLDYYYPKLKKYSISIGVCVILSGISYIVFDEFILLMVLKLLVFSLFLIYWISGLLLFRKNRFTKIFVIAYLLILFSAINYYVLKLVGFSSDTSNILYIKIGGFVEMIILSLAVLYRMKTLKDDNDFMRDEIIDYSAELDILTKDIDAEKQVESEKLESSLSIREDEIFQLIIQGKSNKQIAYQLNISVNTVKFHVKNIYEKLNIKSRKEALVLANS